MENSENFLADGIPKVKWYGVVGEHYAIVMDLLGDSLENLFRRCGRKFTLKTALMLDFLLFCFFSSLNVV